MNELTSKLKGNNLRRRRLWMRRSRRAGLPPARQAEVERLSEQNDHLRARLAQYEERLARARVQALIDSQVKTELLARVNHDLRQPLGAILGFAEMLGDGIFGPVTEAQQRVIGEIVSSNQRLSQMVTDLLDASRLESHNLQLRIDTFSPALLLRQVRAQAARQAERKGLALITEVDPRLPETLRGDASRMTQILNNLVGNAIKFTRRGKVSVRVDLAGAEQPGSEHSTNALHLALSVADTGCGIRAEALDHIFEPFNQVNDPAARENGEGGLGLFIVQQLVQLMDGQIQVESTVGVGSTFTVILPFYPDVMKGE